MHCAVPTLTGLTELQHKVETDLATVSAWYCSNGLKINPTRMELTVLGTSASKRKTAGFSINFDGAQLALPSV